MSTATLNRPSSHRTDEQVLASLRAGDEESFAALVDECQPVMMRLAESLTPTRAAAEAAVHDAWLGVLRGLDGFDGQSTLRAWVLRVLVDGAVPARGALPFASIGDREPVVAPDRFLPADRASFSGHWVEAPMAWDRERLGDRDVDTVLRSAIGTLPPAQRVVVTLRDLNGWSPREVCDALGLSPADQRTLLHRGRSALRSALDAFLQLQADSCSGHLSGGSPGAA
jgi:RNA polymerase sigma-70 factor (ECF subfamily)